MYVPVYCFCRFVFFLFSFLSGCPFFWTAAIQFPFSFIFFGNLCLCHFRIISVYVCTNCWKWTTEMWKQIKKMISWPSAVVCNNKLRNKHTHTKKTLLYYVIIITRLWRVVRLIPCSRSIIIHVHAVFSFFHIEEKNIHTVYKVHLTRRAIGTALQITALKT